MALRKYKNKRSFRETPEPTGGKPRGGSLRFVVQKHDASQLHYDFRLEMGGVLKSWAVPKGPSTDPSVRRLAMQVEDHPFDYKDFEGVIPQGNYGAGTVMLWDEGIYHPLGGKGTKQSEEKKLLAQLEEGSLKIELEGSRLKGAYALVRARGMGDNAWLLIKHKDAYQSKKDVTRQDNSVRTNRTLQGIEKDASAAGSPVATKERIITSTGKRKNDRAKLPKVAAHRRPSKASEKKLLLAAKPAPFPRLLSPMLATLVDRPFNEPGWAYEVKWDGYRALGFMNKGKVALRSRNGKSFAGRFYPVYEALKQWNAPAVVDGEIVVVDEKGVSRFEALHKWRTEVDGALRYYLFDILWYEGKSLLALPLADRREVLRAVLPPGGDTLLLSEDFGATAGEFLEAARKLGLEGIMAKRKASPYTPGVRTRDWLKMKAVRRTEVVIGGYSRNAGTTKPFSSLLAGVFTKGRFVYTGKIGTGFTEQTQREMLKRFGPLQTPDSPFTYPPEADSPGRFRPHPPDAAVVWLRPELVAEVGFTEMTREGLMRHPSFKGLRDDKPARKVVLEKAVPQEKALKRKEDNGHTNKAAARASAKRAALAATPRSRSARPDTLLHASEKTQLRKVEGHEIKFTNLDKIFWPEEKLTKRDLINYYYQVAPVMLPYLKGRPQSLNRYPAGILGKHFYQKDVTGKVPPWIKTYRYYAEGETEEKHFLVADGLASLLYMATMGCIEMNPWNSTIRKPDHPSWCIIDLDPGKKNSFDDVIEAANVTRQVLEQAGVSCYPKTSGATGMHVYIPLGGRYTDAQSREFARIVVTRVHERLPRLTTLERTVSERGGRMYLDFLQNRPQATVAAPYSLRPREGATVSMPLDWDEVTPGLKPGQFTVFNAPDRIRDRGDLFKPVLGKGVSLEQALRRWQHP